MQNINYVTSSQYKINELDVFTDVASFDDGQKVKDLFNFIIKKVEVQENLEVDLKVLVKEEAKRAYSSIKVPCIVEHAGLVFEDYLGDSYPGGLTKPMWNALGEAFLSETHSADRPTIARAVVAYCNGRGIMTFVGETTGKLADEPRGRRDFYWDTVFIPDLNEDDPANGRTYAEIVDDPKLGLSYKMNGISQSAKAMLAFLQEMRNGDPDSLWY